MSTPVLTKTEPPKPPQEPERHDILPTLFGEGQGLYPRRNETFVYSFVVHMVVVTTTIWTTNEYTKVSLRRGYRPWPSPKRVGRISWRSGSCGGFGGSVLVKTGVDIS